MMPLKKTEDKQEIDYWFIGANWNNIGPGKVGIAHGTNCNTTEKKNYLSTEVKYEQAVGNLLVTPSIVNEEKKNAKGKKESETHYYLKLSTSF